MKKTYKKPTITTKDSVRNIFPAVAGAILLGVSLALARGKNEIDSAHTQKLQHCTK